MRKMMKEKRAEREAYERRNHYTTNLLSREAAKYHTVQLIDGVEQLSSTRNMRNVLTVPVGSMSSENRIRTAQLGPAKTINDSTILPLSFAMPSYLFDPDVISI